MVQLKFTLALPLKSKMISLSLRRRSSLARLRFRFAFEIRFESRASQCLGMTFMQLASDVLARVDSKNKQNAKIIKRRLGLEIYDKVKSVQVGCVRLRWCRACLSPLGRPHCFDASDSSDSKKHEMAGLPLRDAMGFVSLNATRQ
jgi:hypothetical protein